MYDFCPRPPPTLALRSPIPPSVRVDFCFLWPDYLFSAAYSWVQEYTWEMTEPSVIDQDLYLGTVGPAAFSKITPRK